MVLTPKYDLSCAQNLFTHSFRLESIFRKKHFHMIRILLVLVRERS